MIQMLSIPQTEYAKFVKVANASGGNEVCGVLVGQWGMLSSTAKEIRMIRNAAERVDRAFIMDPQEYLNAILDTDLYERIEYKTQYLGIIHSHYFDRAFPSIADWNGALGGVPHGPYLIYSVIHEELNAFYWNGKEFLRLEHIICETS
jgi:proteasome lid subunit RPN8/RPN11